MDVTTNSCIWFTCGFERLYRCLGETTAAFEAHVAAHFAKDPVVKGVLDVGGPVCFRTQMISSWVAIHCPVPLRGRLQSVDTGFSLRTASKV
jgi:hypothetical protein